MGRVGRTPTSRCAAPALFRRRLIRKLSQPLDLVDPGMDMEHRCGTRHPTDLQVYIRSHGGTVSSLGRLSNASLSGGFLITTLPAQPLSRISLRFADAQGRPGVGPSLEGHVIRRGAHGLGIEWSEYAPMPIRALIEAAFGQIDPAEVHEMSEAVPY